MSAANFLKKLLDGAEVDWIPMGDERVGTFTRGGGLQKKDFVESGVGCIHYGQIYMHYGTYTHTTKSFVSNEFAQKARMASPGDVVIATTSENDEDVCKAVAWLGDEKIAISSDACFYSHKLNPKFVSYFFQSEQFQKQKIPYITGTKVRRVNADGLAKILIPIPCPGDPERSMAIQGEIVRILDSFTELTAELTAELTQRKKQYNHYRDQLLTFDEDEVEWKTLGDVAKFRRGTAITKKQTKKGKIPVVANGPISTYSHGQHNRDGETVVVARSGAYAGYVSYWNQPIFLTDAFSVHPASNLLLPKFVFYLLQNKQRQLHDMKKGAGVPHVRVKEVEQYGIPIPSLTEQANIVAILDKFDTLTTSISEGLPREIELREKQYAYYRDQLLSFRKPDAEPA
ncbi:restriction endonuclease subunit S [Asaia bogorensis]|uniref:Restriction endonuclease subunit S n=1 Tax=Asaia bogorensis NBRC 16594 TaxID=1231624 RepID=A0AAN4U160_9PROT|nr:restriction endonuclease subunit S [Asaia bogorensis]BAT20516.1 type I restriction-modification system specificity determinant protein [Asaia bogorensis NBRC 16594]GBQ79070.1 restriction endonuclease S subunit [Asaia bogorensis NBRC 16594]GEL52061.1 restriction endonuclease subunit S [Asaia bogorensis NBRC 16594]